MNRRLLPGFVSLAVLALGAMSCNGDTPKAALTTSGSQLAGAAVSQAPTTGGDAAGVLVTGHGEVETPPDTGFFDVGVQVTATSVADARDRAATSATAVISSLKGNGIDARDIKTTGLSIQPQYDYGKNGNEPRITGYMVTNTVHATVRNLDSFTKVIDDAVAAGGDDVRVQGIRFGVDDMDKAKEQAREKAMNDAQTKAEQLAKLGGVTLGKPIAISEVQQQYQPYAPAADMYANRSAAQATPIETGTNTIAVDVTVRWALQ